MYTTIDIRKDQRGLLFRRGDLFAVLGPGRHRRWGLVRRGRNLEIADVLATRFEHRRLDVLLQTAQLAEALRVVDLKDDQRALVWRDDRLFDVLGAGRHAFWKEPYALEFEVFEVGDGRFEHDKLDIVLRSEKAEAQLASFDVRAGQAVLLIRDGRLVEQLGEGRHVFWKNVGALTFQAMDLREQTADVAGQEIMTKDKVTLRLNLVVAWQIVDAERSVTVVADAAKTLYQEAQLALRAAVGTRSLEQLLGEKESLGGDVLEALARRAVTFGVAVRSVGLKDIILPGDMKAILNRVIIAEKEAQANLIRRREETAAARSQANTARLLAENPALARLKELEALQEILAGSDATFVFGNGGILESLRGLVAPKE